MLSNVKDQIESLITMHSLTKINDDKEKFILNEDKSLRELCLNSYIKYIPNDIFNTKNMEEKYSHFVCKISQEEDFSFTFSCTISNYSPIKKLKGELIRYCKTQHKGYKVIKENKEYGYKTDFSINFINVNKFNDFFTIVVWNNLINI